MGATLTGKTSPQTRHGLITMIALRRAKAEHDRRQREAAAREAKKAARAEDRKARRRGWFG